MKRDFAVNILDLNGNEITEQVQADGGVVVRPISVRSVVVNALLARARNEELSGEEQIRRYKLAKRINAGGLVTIDAAEVTLIKKQVAANYTPMAVGFIDELLETDPIAASPEE
jgi:ethanolamine utilization microcompartment shell protein EutS